MLKKVLICLFLLTGMVLAKTGYVSVDKANVLEKPNLFSKVLGVVSYGKKVTYEKKSGAFYVMKIKGGFGYLHQSAISKSKIRLSKTSQETASVEEVAAATKGFNETVEKNYQKKNSSLRFDLLEKGEDLAAIPDFPQTGTEFRKNGKLGEFKNKGAGK